MVGFLPALLNSFAMSASAVMKSCRDLCGTGLQILLFSPRDAKACYSNFNEQLKYSPEFSQAKFIFCVCVCTDWDL